VFNSANGSREAGMKRNWLIWLMCAIWTVCVIESPLASDWQEGFSGATWGVSIDQLPNFVQVGAKEKIAYYVNPDVLYTIDDVEVPNVIYGFYDGYLFAVYAQIDTLEVFAQMRSMLQERFGLPRIIYGSRGEPSVYRWKKDKLKIKLKTNEITRKMKLGLYYTPLSNQVNEALEEKNREGAIQFLPIERDKTPERIPLLTF
jgi:hypothetical protein